MCDDKVMAKKDGAVGWLIFNHPARHNAISAEMSERAAGVLADFSADEAIRVVVLRGAGDKAFISGGDLSKYEHQRSTPEDRAEWKKKSVRAREQLISMGKPTIAMIKGYCLGGGMAWALSCDLRICSEDAKFGIPATKLGIGYEPESMKLLMDVVGPSVAKEMLFTARHYTAHEALRLGLVNQVVATPELEDFIRSYTEVIASNAPLAMLSAKKTIDELQKDSGQRDMQGIAQSLEVASSSQDHIEGRRAFLEKRKPVFTGK